MELVLAGRRQRGERTAVEALTRGHDDVRTTELDLAPATGQLDGALVGLGAGVGKERLPVRTGGTHLVAALVGSGGEQRGEGRGQLAAVLGVEVVARLPELAGLLAQGVDHGGVRVAQARAADAAEKVDVLAARGVHERGAVAGDELDGQAPVGVHHKGIVKLSVLRDDSCGSGVLLVLGHRGLPSPGG